MPRVYCTCSLGHVIFRYITVLVRTLPATAQPTTCLLRFCGCRKKTRKGNGNRFNGPNTAARLSGGKNPKKDRLPVSIGMRVRGNRVSRIMQREGGFKYKSNYTFFTAFVRFFALMINAVFLS